MEYRRLGHSGLQVSVIGLGTNTFGPVWSIPPPSACYARRLRSASTSSRPPTRTLMGVLGAGVRSGFGDERLRLGPLR
jgi:aryl-alcohol dehydrogenase-like predicted oxidoreductase